MSASFLWEVVKPTKARCFGAGTSNDDGVLRETFGDIVSTKDLGTLKAMHRATSLKRSLWSEIADTLERLQGDEYDKEITLRVWTEY